MQKKHVKMDKSYHKLILRSLIAIAGVSILITGISLSSFFLSRLNQNVEDYNNAHLKSVQDEIAGMKDFVSQTGSLLVQDALTKKYLHGQRSVDYVEFGRLLERIRGTATMKDYIDSVYLVYPDRNLALTSFGLFSWDTFQDKTWLGAADPAKAITWQGGHSILTDKLTGARVDVVSAVFSLSWYYPGRDGYVVINLSEKWMADVLEKGDYHGSSLILADERGLRVTAAGRLPFEESMDIGLLAAELGAGKQTTVRFDGEGYLASLRQDPRDGWQYFILTPLSEANASMLQSAAYILFVLAVAVAVSCIVSLRLRNHAYVPVKELVESAGETPSTLSGKNRQYAEFQQISHRFHSILLEKYNVENQITSMLPALKERFFQRLLSGQIIRKTEFDTQLNLLNLDLSVYDSYAVFYIQAELNARSGQERDSSRRKEERWLSLLSVRQRAEEIRGENDRLLCCLEHSIKQLVCVAGFRPGDVRKEKLTDILQSLQRSLPESVSLTVGIGNTVKNPSSLQISANQASEALEQSCLYGKNQILFFSDVCTQSALSYINPLSYEKALTSAVRTCDMEGIRTTLDHVDRLLYDNHYSLRMIRHFYLSIVNFISAFDAEAAGSQPVDGDVLKDLSDLVYRLESLTAIRRTVEEACIRTAETFRQAGRKRAEAVARQICSYLEENYMQDLSLDAVAAHFRFTGTYANRVLKRCREATFYDILTEYRIEKAKELLENTEQQVYQIAASTGYTNVQSFIRMFKKVTGTTPGAYRKEILCRHGG